MKKNIDSKKSRAKDKRLKLYKQKIRHDKKGRLLENKNLLISKKTDFKVARVQPDRRQFGNTRIVGQRQLDKFRNELSEQIHNPYSIILKHKKLPLGLLADSKKASKMNLITTESYESTFGPKSNRKRAKVPFSNMDALALGVLKKSENYLLKNDSNIIKPKYASSNLLRECIFNKGQSKRIYNELYKVIDSSDVLIQVLDARDPQGTRSSYIENQIRSNFKHKHMILLLNKCDLIPTQATARQIKLLSIEYPTIAFHSSITNSFGKGSLIQLLRQFASLIKERKQISVGFVGYPNVGKSSVINTLRKKKVCKVASIPGETKVQQYITLFSKVYLIDCPGVVYSESDSDSDLVLKGVVRVENIEDPSQYIPAVLDRVKPIYLKQAYDIETQDSNEDFLSKFAKSHGKLLKGGEPDINNSARMILYDWQRGKLPWFVCPPFEDDIEEKQIVTEKENKIKEIANSWSKPVYETVQDFNKLSQSHNFDKDDLRQHFLQSK